MRVRNQTAVLTLLCALVVTTAFLGFGYIFRGINDGIDSPPFAFDEPTLPIGDGLSVHIRLASGPSPSAPNSTGSGLPYFVVTLASPSGGINAALLHAEAEQRWSDGADLCRTRLTWDAFYIVSPAGGADNETTNVTYVGDSYSSPLDIAPGGDRCAMRSSTRSIWDLTVYIEGDGLIDIPREENGTTVADSWDLRVCQTAHLGLSAGSPGILKTPPGAPWPWP